ncbi:3-dehydroshikimate dehydratase [Colletotrichum trifolii]|uniref:3-dehydroshikimate dehydratase n=1 Tax=Colletotrichum trifolii TaxID=5466 RepID=A0A4R8RVG5_COLTR|nr:3-dehydroshikimate dehydratase [Colletotrichum trifolii]
MPDYRPALLSASLGRAWLHDFDHKVCQAARYGFQGIEIFYEDLEYLAKKLHRTEEPNTDHLLTAAAHARRVVDGLGLAVIGLQPFLFYEGLKMKVWIRLAEALGTDNHPDTRKLPPRRDADGKTWASSSEI